VFCPLEVLYLKGLNEMVRPAGFEPTTNGLEIREIPFLFFCQNPIECPCLLAATYVFDFVILSYSYGMQANIVLSLLSHKTQRIIDIY